MGDDTRMRIVWAAYDVLVERGYDGFTTQAVADEAGVSQSLVHYYFETKHDLVLALFDEGLATIEEEVDRIAADDDPADRLVSLASFMIDTPDEDALAFKRVLLELTAQAPYDDDLYDVVAHDREFLQGYVADAVREGQDAGLFREDVDPDAFAATYRTVISGAQLNVAVFDEGADGDRVLAGLRDIVAEYLVREDG